MLAANARRRGAAQAHPGAPRPAGHAAPSRWPPRRAGAGGVRLERAPRRLARARALKRPGYEIQRLLGTREPDERQLEVGRAALAEILRVENGVPTPGPCTGWRYWAPMSVVGSHQHNILMWGPMVFMALIVFFLWRTMKLMPQDEAAGDQAGLRGGHRLGRGRGRRRGEGRAAGGRRLPARPEALPRARRHGAQGHPAARPARHGQDAAGQGRRRRVRRAVLRPVGRRRSSRCSPASAPPASGACSTRRATTARRSSSSTRSTPWAPGAARTTTPSASRRSTSCWSRWTASARRGDVVVIAASNLLEKLDPALLRPGRFDRQVFVSPPDVAGREAILKVHTRNKPLEDVDFDTIARQTSGLTGADLANICQRGGDRRRAQPPGADRPGGLRRRARARRGRHAVAPRAQRARAPRRRLPRGRPRAVRRAAARASTARTASRSSRAATRSATR